MLYDNALLARAYLHGHRLVEEGIGRVLWWAARTRVRVRVRATRAGAARAGAAAALPPTMTWPTCAARRSTGRCARCAGPRAASTPRLDADSEGVEGRYYVWRVQELRDLLGEDADAAIGWLGVSEEGNFVDPHHPEPGLNVLTDQQPHRPARHRHA